MEKTNCSMQNIFEWCLRNHMGISFRPMADGYSVNVVFFKRVLGELWSWSHVANQDFISNLIISDSRYWAEITNEALTQLSEATILQKKHNGAQKEII